MGKQLDVNGCGSEGRPDDGLGATGFTLIETGQQLVSSLVTSKSHHFHIVLVNGDFVSNQLVWILKLTMLTLEMHPVKLLKSVTLQVFVQTQVQLV